VGPFDTTALPINKGWKPLKKRRRRALIVLRVVILLGLGLALGGGSAASAEDWVRVEAQRAVTVGTAVVGTAFTYQGQLTDGSDPANGDYEFVFSLFDSLEDGNQIGPITRTVPVEQGLFTVVLDFGPVFDGTALWLDVAVRPAGDAGDYVPLSPRQPLTPAPYASYAVNTSWGGIAGLPPGFADDVDDDALGSLDCASGEIARWNGSAWVCAPDQVGADGGWSLTGNAGTLPGSNFLGTTDDQALELHVNGGRALRLEPRVTSPNILGGYGGNGSAAGVVGVTVAGGGRDLATNHVSADFGTIGGGAGNVSSGYAASIGGGEGNSADGSRATIGGGQSNTALGASSAVGGGDSNTAGAAHATVGGGEANEVTGTFGMIGGGAMNVVSGAFGTVAGGFYNTIEASYGTIAGGGPADLGNPTTSNNRVYDEYGTVGGGGGNVAGDDDGDAAVQTYATVAGGEDNAAAAQHAAVGGGFANTADGYAAAVGGGAGNEAGNNHATIGGGAMNVVSGAYATVAGGRSNLASGSYDVIGGGLGNEVRAALGTIPGGAQNYVGGSYSLAAGYGARAEHDGSFVWSGTTTPFTTTAPRQFLIDASGGVGIGTNHPSHLLTVAGNAAIQSSAVISVGAITGDGKMIQAPRALYAVGDLLYAASYATNTLSIWNVTDPQNDTLIGYTTKALQGPVDLQIVGNRAYLASQNGNRLTILDVSDPVHFWHVGETTAFLDAPQGVHVSGKYAYVASMGTAGRYDGLAIFDVTRTPEVSATGFVTSYLQGTSDVFVVDNYAYVTSRDNHRLVVFDVSDPRYPAAVGYTEAALSAPVHVHVSGIYAYVVAEGTDTLDVFDISNPAQIAPVAQVSTGLTHPRSIYVSGDRAYVAYAGDEGTNQNCGLAVLDISDPAGIIALNVIDMSDWLSTGASGGDLVPPKPVAVTGSGTRVYVANEAHDSVTVFEIDGLEAAAVRTGELKVARLEVDDYAAIQGDLGVLGGLNVGPGGALIQGALTIEGEGDSYIGGRLGIGPAVTVITRSIGPGESEEVVVRHPTHQLDVDGEARFRVNEHNHLILRSPNTGSDEDAFIDFAHFDHTDLLTPTARIEFDAADPVTHTTGMRFYTQGPEDAHMQSRLELTSGGDLRPGADGVYSLGEPERRWDTLYTVNGVVESSDARDKDQVRPLSYGLDEVRALRPVLYSWRRDPDHAFRYGFIAQEVRDVLPEIVAGDEAEGSLSISYSGLVPVLVRAVQEQQQELDAQEARIADLEARLAALEDTGGRQAGPSGWLDGISRLWLGGLVVGALVIVGRRRLGGGS